MGSSPELEGKRSPARIGAAEVERLVEGLLLARIVDVEQVPMYHRPRFDSPEMALQLGVLADALRSILRVHGGSSKVQRREAAEDLAWVESDDDTHLYAFVPVCQRLQLDPDWIRRLVRSRLSPRSGLHAEAA